MKRLLCLTTAVLLLISCAVSVYAADSYVTFDGFTFDLDENLDAVIHDYDDRASEVVFPESLLGKNVVRIDSYAFFRDTAITAVNFEQAIRLCEIGDNAFYGCSSLTALSLPSLTELGFGAFQNCTGLISLLIAEGVSEIPEQCFYCCSSLTEVSLPTSVTVIGARAFSGCTGLQVIDLPDTVSYIAPNAFEGDDNLVIRCKKGSYAAQYAAENNIPVETFFICLRGDADGDGEITIPDATLIQRELASILHPPIILSAADINGDGLDVVDVTCIQRYLADYENIFGISEPITVFDSDTVSG